MEHVARDQSSGVGRGRRRADGSPTPPGPRVLLDGLDPGAASAAAAVVRLVGGEVVGELPRGPARAGQGVSDARVGRGGGPRAAPVAGLGPGDGQSGVDLVLTGDPTRATPRGPSATPSIVVGERGSLRLPGDEELLADVVHAVTMERRGGRSGSVPSRKVVLDSGPEGSGRSGGGPGGGQGSAGTGAGAGAGAGAGDGAGERAPARGGDVGAGRGLVVAVAGWQGGVGTTALVRALAHHAGAVAVDATGAGPGLVAPGEEGAPGVRWADLEVSEPSPHPDLGARLPLLGGGPALVADHRGGATPSDPRLAPVLRHLSHTRDVVVDLGRWDGRGAALTGVATVGAAVAAGGVVDVVCLVGVGDDESAVRLAGAVGVWPPRCPLVVVHTRRAPSSLLERAVSDAGAAGTGGMGAGGAVGGGGAVDGGARAGGTTVTWHFARGVRGRATSRRLSLLWSRMRRLVPDRAGAAIGTGGRGTT